MLAVKENWNEMWNTLISDVHPPLYYIILKIAMLISNYDFQVAKIVSVLPLFLMNLVIIILTLKNKDNLETKTTGILLSLFLVITTLTTNFLFIGQELRMYSWATFFVTISEIYAYKIYNDISKKNITIFILSSLASALTHYFALIMEVIIYVALFIALLIKNKKYIKQIVIITVITILGYIWWLPMAIKQFIDVKNSFWRTFNFEKVIEYFNTMIGRNVNGYVFAVATLFITIVCLRILYNLKIEKYYNNENKNKIIFAFLAILFPFTVTAIGIILNVTIKPIFGAKYMIPSLGIFWLGIIILLNYIDHKKIFINLAVILVIAMIVIEYPKAYKKERLNGTGEMLEIMEKNVDENDIITSNYEHLTWTILEFYFPNNDILEINEVNFYEESRTIWFFSSIELPENAFIKANHKETMVHEGNIDNEYKIYIYKLEKIR